VGITISLPFVFQIFLSLLYCFSSSHALSLKVQANPMGPMGCFALGLCLARKRDGWMEVKVGFGTVHTQHTKLRFFFIEVVLEGFARLCRG
jgi:hypothetical protein